MFLPVANLLEPGIGQLLIILAIALLFFGHKLPQLARSLGSSVNEFKKGFKDDENPEAPSDAEVKKDIPPDKK